MRRHGGDDDDDDDDDDDFDDNNHGDGGESEDSFTDDDEGGKKPKKKKFKKGESNKEQGEDSKIGGSVATAAQEDESQKPTDPHRRIYKYWRGLLKGWERDLNARPDEVKRTVQVSSPHQRPPIRCLSLSGVVYSHKCHHPCINREN